MKYNKYLIIARTLVKMNKCLDAALTGSLMMIVRNGFEGVEPKDIDIVIDCPAPNWHKHLWLIDGMTLDEGESYEGCDVDDMYVFYYDGIRIDFIRSTGTRESVKGWNMATIADMEAAKAGYEEDRLKRQKKRSLDLEELINRINVSTTTWTAVQRSTATTNTPW